MPDVNLNQGKIIPEGKESPEGQVFTFGFGDHYDSFVIQTPEYENILPARFLLQHIP